MTRESIRTWCVKFSDLFAEMHLDVSGIPHWLWRAVDEYGIVLDVLLERHRDTEAARPFFIRLLAEHGVPKIVRTDKLWS